jgi:hypothetical protein
MWTLICTQKKNLHNIDLPHSKETCKTLIHMQKKSTKYKSMHTWMHLLDMYITPPKLGDGKKSHKLKPFVKTSLINNFFWINEVLN